MVASIHPGSPVATRAPQGSGFVPSGPAQPRAPAAGGDGAASPACAGEQALRQALARPAQVLPGGLVLRSLGLQSYQPT